MLRYRVLFAALATLPVSALVHAQAQQKAAPMPPTAMPGAPAGGAPAGADAKPTRFDELDTNHDGFISRDEFLAGEKKRFDEFDTNNDGKIDAKEIASSPPLMERNLRTAERMVKQWDTNGDGIVTADEYKKNAEDRFQKQDKDGTGKIARRVPPPGGMRPGQPPQMPGQPAPLQPVPPADGKH